MEKIKITQTAELIQFIEKTNLSFRDYSRIVSTFCGSKFMAFKPIGYEEFTQRDKENLISLIEKCQDTHIKKGLGLPFLTLGR